MTRKDYIKIAGAIKDAYKSNADYTEGQKLQWGGCDNYPIGQNTLSVDIVANIVRVLKEDNPNFDRERFYAAIGDK